MNGIHHTHLKFRYPNVAKEFIKVITNRGAKDIKIEETDEIEASPIKEIRHEPTKPFVLR